MTPTGTPHTPDSSIPTPGSYPLYEYPAYTFDKKYENDEFQKKVITLDSGYHLVLAPPGCGKTDILAERVVRALSCGVSLDDMLCLTFTNRAARGMRSRILERLQTSEDILENFSEVPYLNSYISSYKLYHFHRFSNK